MKILFKYFLRILAGFALLIAGYILVAFVLSILSTNPDQVECEERKEIYVVSNGVHVSFIIPVNLLEDEIHEELDIPGEIHYISFGWGDKVFYIDTPTWDQLKLSVALKALFIRSESALHLIHYYNKSDSWSSLKICHSQYDRLLAYVLDSFEKDSDRHIIKINSSGYTKNDRFYEAKGSYTLFNTCNDWVNIGLKKSQIKTAIWSPFDYGVMRHVKRMHQGSD